MEVKKGYISKFSYADDNSGYYVFDLITASDEVICVGNARGFSVGETVQVEGEYYEHPVYGLQIKVKKIEAVEPDTEQEIERYLGSGAIKGIGPSMAAKIVKEFGADTFRVAMEEPERLAIIKGISAKKAYDICGQLTEKRDAREAMLFLQKYGITMNLANKIYVKYGLGLYEVIKDNPYKLVDDIRGVGFKIADEIAGRSGIKVDSDYRVKCGILHVLNEHSYDGHTYCLKDELISKAAELLKVNEEIIDIQLTALRFERRVVIKNDKVYHSFYYYEEEYCARKLLELDREYDGVPEETDEELAGRIRRIASKNDFVLDDLQLDAVSQCVRNGVFVLSGGPGTGKTTTINTIINYFAEEGLDFCLAAPTGRAAKRISETTGYEAKTIHRLLENHGGDRDDDRKAFFDRNEMNPLEADAIIIDEMSMVDIHLMKALLCAMLPGMKLVLVGDSNQLSSVGPGEVLRDILDSKCFASVSLKKIYRQDEESHIIANAFKINQGEDIDFSAKYRDFFLLEKDEPEVIYGYIDVLVKNNIAKEFSIGPLDTQILTPMRNGLLGVNELNRVLQTRLNPGSPDKPEHTYGDTIFRVGDKVMQIRNDYNLEWEIIGDYNVVIEKGAGVYNGDVGRITKVDNYLKEVIVLFEDEREVRYTFDMLDELELAYAITIHKSQGSEYPVVIIPVLSGPKMLLTRNLLYTAVTRSRQCVILIGSSKAFLDMIHTDSAVKRCTSLDERIIELAEKK